MLIPQGMAYALIAGLSPIYGLYASLVPLVVYALFGTSRQLAVGPVAMVSLLVAAAVAPMADGNTELYVGLALLLSLMVGVLQFGLGVARFGFLVNFLSHPVLSGFTSAAAFIIGLSQLKHLLGIDLPRSNYVHEILWAAGSRLGDVHGLTLLLGFGSTLVLVGLRRWAPSIPGALVAVGATTGVVWALGLAQQGVAIVGSVPSGLPSPSLPPLEWDSVQQLAPSALAIGLVGFMESIAVAKVYASRHRYEVDANQELIGLGLANIAGAFFSAYPTTGGFSRTAVNDPALRAIVVDMYPVNQIDSTATHTLQEIIETCRRNGVQLYLAGVKGPVKDVLDAAGLTEELGEERFFLEVHDAVEAAEAQVDEEAERAASEEPMTSR